MPKMVCPLLMPILVGQANYRHKRSYSDAAGQVEKLTSGGRGGGRKSSVLPFLQNSPISRSSGEFFSGASTPLGNSGRKRVCALTQCLPTTAIRLSLSLFLSFFLSFFLSLFPSFSLSSFSFFPDARILSEYLIPAISGPESSSSSSSSSSSLFHGGDRSWRKRRDERERRKKKKRRQRENYQLINPHTHTQPPKVACGIGSSVGTRTRCAHVFRTFGRRLAC